MRLKLTLAYVGTAFSGWQRQPAVRTVQGVLEEAASSILQEPALIVAAGRTDAGVHAEGQVAHVDVPDRLTLAAWRKALNARLPWDVRVLEAQSEEAAFHARYGAVRKHYVYSLDPATIASPFRAPYAWHQPRPLALGAMREAAGHLRGIVDMAAFATCPNPGKTKRHIDSVEILTGAGESDLIRVSVVGRSFLRRVVRGIVGTLVEVGYGVRTPETLAELARNGDRQRAGTTAPAHGLCLMRVDY